MGTKISILCLRFLCIISAEPINILLSDPFPKEYILECSKNCPRIDLILIFPDGFKEQIPRTIISISTPAFDASLRALIMNGSVILFSFKNM